MALLDDLKKLLDELAPKGWKNLFLKHGLDITKPLADLKTELTKLLPTIDRAVSGFEEFALDGIRAVEAGNLGCSLLYHALASADVVDNGITLYPTLAQLDLVENYVFSLAPRKLSSFQNPVVAVFAYQYRDKAHATHRQHADVAFSRTGVSRVGTEDERYVPELRGFESRPQNGDRGFAALPARYAVFIAERRTPSAADSVMRGVAIDSQLSFLFPVHKVFAGDECLLTSDGTPLIIPKLEYGERHVNEKLAKIHRKQGTQNPGFVKPLPGFKIGQPPFVRDSATSKDLVTTQVIGASVLIKPVKNTIVRTATQTVSGVKQLARFKVPKATNENRFWTSLQLSSTDDGRAAPEYANIRQEVVNQSTGKPVDINQVKNAGTPPAQQFDKKLAIGGYEASHFIDSTCDGCVSIKAIAGLPGPVQPAFSLVTAIDFFPQVDQMEVQEWVEQVQSRPIGLGDVRVVFPQGGPAPLSDGRFFKANRDDHVPNTTLPDPFINGSPAFSAGNAVNLTATAIVGRAANAGSHSVSVQPRRATHFLPDAASGVFAPGWDVSEHTLNGTTMYASYGLGSPFPEDAKLCAALNSFWPAVAPDSSRTYGRNPGSGGPLRTSIPMLDSELGYHSKHLRVVKNEVPSNLGWDGDHGPYFENATRNVINASNPNRADLTRAAFDGRFGFSGLDQVTTQNFIDRIDALMFCYKFDNTLRNFWLVTVERVPKWSDWNSQILKKLDNQLTGSGLIFVFAQVAVPGTDDGDPPLRLKFNVTTTVEIQLDTTQAFVSQGGTVSRVER